MVRNKFLKDLSPVKAYSRFSDIAIFIGNILDHFDSAIYGFLAPILAPIFFPNQETVVQYILTYSILATSIVTRPIGAIIFGIIANSYGPILSLSYSLIGIAISAIALGCLPGYSTIGYIAPLSLILIRMLRGIFASGENTIASLYVVEDKTLSNDAFKASYRYAISTMLGIILASLSSSIIINNNVPNAWRFCFWLGGIAGLIGYYLRRISFKNLLQSTITPQQTIKTHLTKRSPYNLDFFLQHKADIITIAIVTGFTHVTYALVFILLNSLVPLMSNKITLSNMVTINSYLLIFDLLIIVTIGRIILNYQFNYTKLMLVASAVLAITMLPLFNIMENGSMVLVTLIRVWIIFWAVCFVCPLNLWCEQFLAKSCRKQEKYFLMGIGSSIGAATIGKTCVAVCLYLWYKTHSYLAPALYITLLILLTVGTLLLHYIKSRDIAPEFSVGV